MPDCNETLRELHAFLDGELSSEARAHIDLHLEECTDCLQAFDFHAELKMAIRRKCASDELPPGLMARIEMCLKADLGDNGVIGDWR